MSTASAVSVTKWRFLFVSKGSESNRLAKECIVTALVELMKIRDYDSISITDIAKKAGVSRMAY